MGMARVVVGQPQLDSIQTNRKIGHLSQRVSKDAGGENGNGNMVEQRDKEGRDAAALY